LLPARCYFAKRFFQNDNRSPLTEILRAKILYNQSKSRLPHRLKNPTDEKPYQWDFSICGRLNFFYTRRFEAKLRWTVAQQANMRLRFAGFFDRIPHSQRVYHEQGIG
jgi:hypothetical protein